MERKSEEREQHSAKFLRQRKFLLIAPVLVIPFLVILLWSIGLVGDAKAEPNSNGKLQGLNFNLPTAAPAKDSNWNKLRYYEQAEKDSAKLKSQLHNDPLFQDITTEEEEDSDMKGMSEAELAEMQYGLPSLSNTRRRDRNEQKVYQKIARLQQALNREPERELPQEVPHSGNSSADIDRLEQMMHQVTNGKEPDAELTQLNGMLEKIMDIQNPERVQEKLKQQSEQNKRQAFAVQIPPEDVVSRLHPRQDINTLSGRYNVDSLPGALKSYVTGNRFYSLDDVAAGTSGRPAIAASIPETQTLVSGATVKMRLLEDVFVAGVKIPKDHFVYGQATLNGERLQIAVSSIEYQNRILPVALTVYDKKDGLAGISIPGAITRDVAKKAAAQSVQGIGTLGSLDPSIGTQMATAGLQMAQNLVGRSARLVRVTVEAGYPVLLKDDNQKDK